MKVVELDCRTLEVFRPHVRAWGLELAYLYALVNEAGSTGLEIRENELAFELGVSSRTLRRLIPKAVQQKILRVKHNSGKASTYFA